VARDDAFGSDVIETMNGGYDGEDGFSSIASHARSRTRARAEGEEEITRRNSSFTD
jgi:hypothetical protein